LAWHYRGGCIRVVCLQVILLSFGLAGLGLTGVGIDVVKAAMQPGSPPPHWPWGITPPAAWSAWHTLTAIAAAILALALARAALNCAYSVAVAKLVQGEIVTALRAQVYDTLQRLSFRFFDANASSSLINRVTRDVQATRLFIDGVLIQSLIMGLSLLVYVVYMSSIHVGLTLACLATTPLLWGISVRFSRLVRPAYRQNRELVDRLVTVLSESVQGIAVIKGFAREPHTLQRFAAANAQVRDQNFWIFGRVTTFGPLITFISQLNLVVLLAFGGALVMRGTLPLGTGLIVFAGLLQQFSSQVANLSNLANSIQESLTGARRVFEVIDTPVEILSPPNARRLAPHLPCTVEFEHVRFGYDPEAPVLRDVSFVVQPGQCVAILGATGAGKSTLLSLIPRFYDSDAGRVLVDGTDVRELHLDDLRRNVGIVFQENFLFSNSVAACIAFGRPNATREQIERAARVAAAHRFIEKLPQGYDTVVGESGKGLSGGQRQRLAIARAILLEPSILLLDDPTAAIDSQTEHEILEAMESAMAGRTTFVVAHRLSTLRRADFILVLENGRIIQAGRHAELAEQKGPYRWIIAHQLTDEETRRLLAAPPGVSALAAGGLP
jgi:ATP-binding cassette subfamily B protein